MKWAAIILGIVVGVVLTIVLVGALLPQSHVAARAIRLRQKPAEVFTTITSVTTAPTWRNDLTRVEMLPPSGGRMAWREMSANGTVPYEAVQVVPPMDGVPGRFVTRITDRSLPYGGSWIIEVAGEGPGTRVVVTERGEVYNVFFRFVSKFIMGHAASIDAYLKALGRHHGQEVEPEPAMPLDSQVPARA